MSATIPHTVISLSDPQLAVRRTRCSLCGAPPLEICQRKPRAEHLQRWIDAYRLGRISRDEIAGVFGLVVIITRCQVVPEVSA